MMLKQLAKILQARYPKLFMLHTILRSDYDYINVLTTEYHKSYCRGWLCDLDSGALWIMTIYSTFIVLRINNLQINISPADPNYFDEIDKHLEHLKEVVSLDIKHVSKTS